MDRAQPETDEVPLATSDNPAFVGNAYSQSFHKAVALMLRFDCHTESWPIAGTFTIARGSKTAAQVVVVKLSDGKHEGQGEAVPYARYHENVEATLVALQNAKAEIEKGIEGLIHISEMSWSKNLKTPKGLVDVGMEVEAIVLKIDEESEKISLGLKQLLDKHLVH